MAIGLVAEAIDVETGEYQREGRVVGTGISFFILSECKAYECKAVPWSGDRPTKVCTHGISDKHMTAPMPGALLVFKGPNCNLTMIPVNLFSFLVLLQNLYYKVIHQPSLMNGMPPPPHHHQKTPPPFFWKKGLTIVFVGHCC